MQDSKWPSVRVPNEWRTGAARFPDALVVAISGLLIIPFCGLSLAFVLHEMARAA